MIVISNSSPLISLGRIHCLSLFQDFFEKIYIPTRVYEETVLETNIEVQKKAILQAIEGKIIEIVSPVSSYPFRRKLDSGERGVLNLAFDMKADLLILDEKKARNEAKELNFEIQYTSALLREAGDRKLIPSYSEAMKELKEIMIFLPE